MESPVVLDKPPEYHGKDDRGFPFEEEEGSGAWSDLAARHPDIAARLRQHPAAANWARKRRPASQDADGDLTKKRFAIAEFGDTFSNFDRFPFEDIPPEFREHFPSHFNRRFGQREERAPQQPQSPQPQTSQSPPKQQTIATQTEHDPPEPAPQHTSLPQYGLRNTVDLGQKSAADPSLVDADERNQRSVSAPPESRNHAQKMSAQNHQEPPHGEHTSQAPKVRNIPIMVEGRDKPVINDTLDSASHFGDTKPTYHHPPQQPLDNPYFAEESAPYTQPPNFSKAFGSPYSKNYKSSQPFAQQKVYPQTYARGASPARSQSPKPKEDVKIPVQHEPPKPQARPEPPRPQPKPQQQQPPPQQQQQQQQPPKQPTPPPASKPQPPDPITQILAIQTDVLNLMTEVEKFTGTKKDKRYIYLDEMLTRNLLKLDNIETEGKENIKNARKEAVKCIQKCIAVLEAKADSQSASSPQQENEDSQGHDAGMNAEGQTEQKPQNGEVDMKATGEQAAAEKPAEDQKPKDATPAPVDYKQTPQATDTRPEEAKPEDVDNKPKKATKGKVKSKDKSANRDQTEPMQVDEKGENKDEPQQMEVDGAASQ